MQKIKIKGASEQYNKPAFNGVYCSKCVSEEREETRQLLNGARETHERARLSCYYLLYS
jgi:hypothetical protein